MNLLQVQLVIQCRICGLTQQLLAGPTWRMLIKHVQRHSGRLKRRELGATCLPAICTNAYDSAACSACLFCKLRLAVLMGGGTVQAPPGVEDAAGPAGR